MASEVLMRFTLACVAYRGIRQKFVSGFHVDDVKSLEILIFVP